MTDIDDLLQEIDSLDKLETKVWYGRNKLKLVSMIMDTADFETAIEMIAQKIGSGIITQVKQELRSLCKLEAKKRREQQFKETLNIDISSAHTSKKGEILPDYFNLFLIGETELWDKIRFDDFSGTVRVLKPLPWSKVGVPFEPRELQDHDVTEAVSWYNSFGVVPRRNDVGHVLVALAMRNNFDAYIEHMDAKPTWDGKRRLNTWLFRYCGSWPRDPKEWRIISAYGRKLFLSMVARCYDPGCMARLVFMFEGNQNIMKSLFVEAIGDPFFATMTGKNLDLSKSDSHSILNGAAMIEIPENVLARRNDSETMKAYFALKYSKVRLPYGHSHVILKRRNIFSITLNPGADKKHLNDPTGASRYCPIECGVGKSLDWKIDLEGFISVRDQLFAEAIVAYKNGEKWWLDSQQEQWQRDHTDTRNIDNPAEYFVCKYLEADRQYEEQGLSIDFVIETMNKMNGCPRFSRQLIAGALKNLGFEQDRFTLTEAERRIVKTSTRQLTLWFLKGTKLKIMSNRNDDPTISIFNRVLTTTF